MLLNVVPMHPRVGFRTVASFEEHVVVRFARDHLHSGRHVFLLFSSHRSIGKEALNLSWLWRIEFFAATQLGDRFDCARLQEFRPEFLEELA